jgi:hypothetical protein
VLRAAPEGDEARLRQQQQQPGRHQYRVDVEDRRQRRPLAGLDGLEDIDGVGDEACEGSEDNSPAMKT